MKTVVMMLALAAQVAEPAQQPHSGRVAGTIVDAVTGGPLAGAVVLLEPEEAGTLSTPWPDLAQAALRQAVSDARGAYRFDGLPRGAYVLRVERLGYRPERVEIALGSGGAPRLSLGLRVEPIPMEPLVVSTRAGAPGRVDPRNGSTTAASVAADELRRSRYLESDTRLITGRDVATSGSFPEPDLLRAIQAVPGVSTRDDYSAELWTRASPWGHTRVYLDDVPLFDPFFAAGTLTALGPAAVGGVFLHPGARPVSIGEGAAGVVRLGTRRAEEVEGLPLVAEMGLGTMQATTERRFFGGDAGLLFSARRSWFDRVWNTFVDDGHDPEGPFDYRANSSFWRGDARIGSRAELVVSSYRGGDELLGNAAALITGTAGDWGNTVDQASLSFPLGSGSGRVVVGRSQYDADVHPAPESFVEPLSAGVAVLRPGTTQIRYHTAKLHLEPGSARGLSAGLELTSQRLVATGVATPAASAGSAAATTGERSIGVLTLWGSYRRPIASRWEVEGGLRIDAGSRVLGRGSVRPGPHVAVRYRPDGNSWVSLAGRRSYQYLQQVDAAGTTFGAGQTFGHVWALAGERVPLLSADVVSVGFERRLTAAWWLVANGWLRHSGGMTTRDPRLGATPTHPVTWVVAENRAGGVEVQLRRMIGAWTGQLGYAWARSDDRVGETRYASGAHRTHTLDAAAAWRVRPGLRIGAALRTYSGAPFTRVLDHPCVDDLGRTSACATPDPWQYRGRAGAGRGPGYASLDLGIDWVRRHERWGWGVAVELGNALAFDNRGGYRGTECRGEPSPAACVTGTSAIDRFQRLVDLPLPTAHVRVWF